METTIPKQLYVTVQYRSDASTDSGLLGFASPYTKDSAFRKRKNTQDNWAYGYGVEVNIDENDDITVSGSGNRGGYGRSATTWDASMLFIANCHPRIVDNEPIEGFQIAKSVRRSSGWNGSGNVLWRIADPRGFELEVSSNNFASIVLCSVIDNGVIKGKCVWGRNGKDNILLPETSQPYMDAVKHTTKVNTKVSLKDVQVGDMVEIMSAKVAKADQNCQYLGKYFFLETEEGSDEGTPRYRYRSGNGIYSFTKQSERYLFKTTNGEYFVLASPKISSVTQKIDVPLNKVEVAKEVTGQLSRSFTVRDTDGLILVSATKIDPAAISTTLVPLTETLGESWPKVDNYRTDAIICKVDGRDYLASQGYYHSENGPMITEVDLSTLGQNKLRVKTTLVARDRYYGDRVEPITHKVERVSTLDKYRIVVTVNGVSANVYRLR